MITETCGPLYTMRDHPRFNKIEHNCRWHQWMETTTPETKLAEWERLTTRVDTLTGGQMLRACAAAWDLILPHPGGISWLESYRRRPLYAVRWQLLTALFGGPEVEQIVFAEVLGGL